MKSMLKLIVYRKMQIVLEKVSIQRYSTVVRLHDKIIISVKKYSLFLYTVEFLKKCAEYIWNRHIRTKCSIPPSSQARRIVSHDEISQSQPTLCWCIVMYHI